MHLLTELVSGPVPSTLQPSPTPPAQNLPPTITAGPTVSQATGTVENEYAFSITASDPNNDPLTYVWDFGTASFACVTPASGCVSVANPTIRYTVRGDYPVTVSVSDGSFTAK